MKDLKLPLVVGITCLILVSIFVVKVLSSHGWTPKTFILEKSPEISFDRGWGTGYDAQFYYQIALDPLNAIDKLDNPVYRYQRIFFPALVRLLSLGKPIVIPWVMLVVNLVSAMLGCTVLAYMLIQRTNSPWISIGIFISLGYLFALRFDLLEPLMLSLALIGWLLYEKGQEKWAIFFLAISGLTKEVGLVFPAALAIWLGINKKTQKMLAVLAGSFLPYIFWTVGLSIWIGETNSIITPSTPLIIPFYGFTYLNEPISQTLILTMTIIPAIFFGSLALREGFQQYSKNHQIGKDVILLLANVIFISILPKPTWSDPIAILRTGIGFQASLLLWISATNQKKWLPLLFATWIASSIILLFIPDLL